MSGNVTCTCPTVPPGTEFVDIWETLDGHTSRVISGGDTTVPGHMAVRRRELRPVGGHRVTDTTAGDRPAYSRAGSPASREISCTAVYQRLYPLLGEPGPTLGTPAWLQLDDTDPAAWRSVLWAALQWAVAQDARQEHLAEASKTIAAAENWAAVARSIHRRQSGLYIPRKAS